MRSKRQLSGGWAAVRAAHTWDWCLSPLTAAAVSCRLLRTASRRRSPGPAPQTLAAPVRRRAIPVGRALTMMAGAASTSRPSPISQRIIGQAADLHVVAERIGHVQAVEPAFANVFHTKGLQFRLCPLAIEIRNRVGHMVDERLHLRPRHLAGRLSRIEIAGPEDEMGQRYVLGGDIVGLLAFLAERQRHVLVAGTDLIEVEDLGVPVRGLPEIRAGVGDVIDERGL